MFYKKLPLASVGLCLVSSNVVAQEVDTAITDAIIVNNQTEQNRREPITPGLQQPEERSETEGPYILIKEDIFNYTLRFGVNYSDNPSTTSENALGGDINGSALIDIGFDTRSNGVDFGGHVYTGTSRYSEQKNLESAYAAGFIYAGKRLGKTNHYLRAQLDRGSNYNRDFDNSSPYYSAKVSWSHSFQLPAFVNQFSPAITPSASYTRYDYRNSSLNYDAYSGGVSFAQRFSEKLSGDLNVAYTERDYDDFFESATGVARRDENTSLSVNLHYTLTKSISVSFNVGYNDNRSTLGTSEYDALSSGLNFSFRKSF